MKDYELLASEFGTIDPQGKLNIYNRDHFLKRVARYPATNIEFMVIKREGGFTHPMRTYYFTVLVPEMQKAFEYTGVHMSRGEVDYWLREQFLYNEEYDPETDEWIKTPCRLNNEDSDVGFSRFKTYLETIIQFAATDMDWSIAYPNEILSLDDYTERQIRHGVSRK